MQVILSPSLILDKLTWNSAVAWIFLTWKNVVLQSILLVALYCVYFFNG